MEIIRNKNSIARKLLIPMIVIVIVQVILFVGTIFTSGIVEILRNNSFNILNQKIELRKNYLENEMIQRWSNIGEYQEKINSRILENLKSRGMTVNDFDKNPQVATDSLKDISNELVYMLRKNYVTGAFIILNTDSQEKPGLYIRDLDPNSNPKDNSDLLMERGSASTARNLGIPLDTLWNNKFTFNGAGKVTATDFFEKPIKAANDNLFLDYKDLGYWSKPFALNDKDMKIVTYSVPLFDEHHKPYGVIGVALSLKYLNSQLDYNELTTNGQGVYVIGIDEGSGMDFDEVMSTGPMINRILSEDKKVSMNGTEVFKSIYELNTNDYLNRSYGCVKYINLYNLKSPFKDEKCAIIGIVGEDNLLYYSNRFTRLLSVSLILSSVIGVAVVLIAGARVTRPIRYLAEDVKKRNPIEPLILKKTNISEIDELSEAIEILSTNLVDSASKLSQIIKLFNMPIGAFEYKKGNDMVFCTETFFQVIGIQDVYKNDSYVYIKDFEKIIEEIIVHEENLAEDIYKIAKEDNSIRWIKLKILEHNSRMLGVVSDVTQEILEKHKIEYERDYDILTDILNRRAFYRTVEERIRKARNKIGAFIMWDLDNLKYVNDTYGHDYGDEYIRKAAVELKRLEEYGGVVGRRSGDEFFVFIYGYENKDEIRKIIRDIHDNVENTVLKLPNNRELKIRISTGVAWFPDDAANFEELSKYSDFAMYKIKRTVKGNISEFSRKEYEEESFLLSSQEDLNKLLDEELIQYAFQPIVDAKTGKIFAYEALMRSQLENLQNPLHIIKLATADSRLYEIERITFFKALEGFLSYMEEFKDVKLFVNSIPNHALSEKDVKRFENLYGAYLDRLVIELLENERSNGTNISKKRKACERWNAQIAIDDFGSGYNNEAVLLAITPNYVKIDMEIVRGINKDLDRQQISKNLISYAKQRKIKVVAEGVETKEELEKLIELGVDYLQGYYLSKPKFVPPNISKVIVNEIININNNFNKHTLF